MRLIDADELRKCAIPCEIHNGALTELCIPLYQLDNAPTADDWQKYSDERPKGAWIFKHGSSDVWCSVCDISIESNLCEGIKFRFCPICGADMRGEKSNE